MTSTEHPKDLFLDAVDLPDEERRVFLERLQTRDADLHGRVLKLLAAHDRALDLSSRVEELIEEPGNAGESVTGALPVVIGDYELLAEIASGGMGVVYRARQISLGRTVAVKLLRSGRLATEAEIERFRSEAEAAARLDHPHIVPIYEVGAYEGRHYISMRLIEGNSLDACLPSYQRDHRAGAELLARIARAVHHGHRRGVLHRDLKPQNVLLDSSGTPHVADFGTAKLVDGAGRQTLTGWICGTPSYMAPEQAAANKEVTVGTDVYALGCILYEMLTGRPPFEASSLIELLRQVQEDSPVSPRERNSFVHRDLETICMACLAKEPTRRYDSALALAEDLERWFAFEPIRARPTTIGERVWLAWRRKPLVAGLLTTVALLVIVLAVVATIASIELRERLAQETLALDKKTVAEEQAQGQLREAYLAQARAAQLSSRSGRRRLGIDFVTRAGEIRGGIELVSEAAACLALSDFAETRRWVVEVEESATMFDPSFEHFVYSRPDGAVVVRETGAGQAHARREPLFELEGTGEPAWRFRFSPDGRYLALVHHGRNGGGETCFRVWDVEERELLLHLPELPVGYAAWSPDGRSLALMRAGGERIDVLDLSDLSFRPLKSFDEPQGSCFMAHDPGGERLAITTGSEGVIQICDASDGEPLGTLTGSPKRNGSIAWSPDGSRLLAGSFDFTAVIWDVATETPVQTLRGHRAEVVWVAYLDDDLVATRSWDATSRLWNAHSGEELVYAQAAAVTASADGRQVGFASTQMIGIWEVRHSEVVRTLHAHEGKGPNTLEISADGRYAVSGSIEGAIVWDVKSGERLDDVPLDVARGTVFDPHGEYLLVASSDGLSRIPFQAGRLDKSRAETVHEGYVGSVALSADGGVMAYRSSKSVHVRFRDDASRDHDIPVVRGMTRLAVSPDGKWIACGSWRGSGARVWNANTGILEAIFVPEETSTTATFSPDSQWIIVGTSREYQQRPVGHWRQNRSFPSHRTGTPCFSSDGRLLALESGLWNLDIRDFETGRRVVLLEAPEPQPLVETRFTPDGGQLWSACNTNRIQVWDLVALGAGLESSGLGHDWPIKGTAWTSDAEK